MQCVVRPPDLSGPLRSNAPTDIENIKGSNAMQQHTGTPSENITTKTTNVETNNKRQKSITESDAKKLLAAQTYPHLPDNLAGRGRYVQRGSCHPFHLQCQAESKSFGHKSFQGHRYHFRCIPANR